MDKNLKTGIDASISILADNVVNGASLGENGFCAYISIDGQSYLFDTGITGICAIKNAYAMEINLRNISGIILSHGHLDHTAGLLDILQVSGTKTVLAHPAVWERKYKINQDGSRLYVGIPFVREFLEDIFKVQFNFQTRLYRITEHLYMTGEVPLSNSFEKIPEKMKILMEDGTMVPDTLKDDNTLIMDTPKGLVFLCGCAHRGLVNIMEYGKKVFNKPIFGFIGGTHLMEVSENQFNNTVDYLKSAHLSFIAPTHCTGHDKLFELRKLFTDIYIQSYTGKVFEF